MLSEKVAKTLTNVIVEEPEEFNANLPDEEVEKTLANIKVEEPEEFNANLPEVHIVAAAVAEQVNFEKKSDNRKTVLFEDNSYSFVDVKDL